MKFTCERCGKRFASVDEPTAGRVYRIRCRCGNVIHITSPHADPDAGKRSAAVSAGDRSRITGGSPTAAAMPPLPAGPRSVIPAGDMGSRVHATSSGTPARVADPAVARRTESAVATHRSTVTRTPTGTQPLASREGATGAHPLATPVSTFDLGDASPVAPSTPARELTPPWTRAPASTSSSFPIPMPAPPAPVPPARGTGAPVRATPTFPSASDVLRPPRVGAAAATPAHPERTPLPQSRRTPTQAVQLPPPDADPFAAAAAQAARGNQFETTAPVFARSPVTVPPFVAPAAPKPPSPEHEDETSVELSVSEQYALPPPKRRHAVVTAIVAGVVGVAFIGVIGAYVLQRRSSPERDAVALAAAPTAPSAAPMPVAPPPPPTTPPVAAEPVVVAPEVAPPAQPIAPAVPVDPAAVVAAAGPPVAPAAPPIAAAPVPPPPPALVAAAPPAPAPEPPPRVVAAAPRPEPTRAPPQRASTAKPSKPEPAPRRAPEQKVAAAAPAREPARAPVAPVERAPDPPKAPPAPIVAAPPPPPRPPPPPAAAPKPSQGLDPSVMQSIIARSRPGFDACVEKALQDPVTASYAGRKAALLLLVAPDGKAEAALEDGDLDASPFGACLRRVASKMGFPTFQGDEVGARLVLVLGRAN